MKPTPRKLALAMSIAGLGASLGGGAHARSDGDAARLAGLSATVGLPLPASDDGFPASMRVRVEGFPLALVAQPLDRILAATDKGDIAAPGRPPCAGAARGQLAPATARPRSLWGARRAAASMPPAPPVASGAPSTPAEASVPGDIADPPASGCAAAPVAETAAAPGAAEGPTVRRPKARSTTRPVPAISAQRTAAADTSANRASATDRVLGELAQHLAASDAGKSAARPGPAIGAQRIAAADAPADRASAADRALGELAHHLAGIAAAAQVDIDLGEPHAATVPVRGPSPAPARTLAEAGAAQAVDLYLEIDPVTEPGTVASPGVLSDAPATAAAQVDIVLDLDFDLRLHLRSADAFGAAAGSAAAAVEGRPAATPTIRAAGALPADRAARAPDAVLDLELDLDLPAAPIGASHPPAAAAAEAGRPVPAIDLGLAHGSPTTAAGLDLNLDLPDLGLGRSAAASVGAPTAAALTAEPAPAPVPAPADTAPAVASASPDVAPRPVDGPVPPASLQALGVPAAAPAGLPPVTTLPQPAALGELLALGESRLDEVRGGFQTSDGLQLSLGIERAVYINGNLVTTPSLNVVGIGTPPGAPTTVNVPAAGAAGVTLVQQGAGNTFLPGPLFPAAGTIIQNTLDGQTIRSVTSVNAMVNSLEVMRARSFESSVRGMIIDSLRR